MKEPAVSILILFFFLARFEVLTVVNAKITVSYYDTSSCNLAYTSISEHPVTTISTKPKDGGSEFLRNIGTCLPKYLMPRPRIP
jgi:hypothetical protein